MIEFSALTEFIAKVVEAGQSLGNKKVEVVRFTSPRRINELRSGIEHAFIIAKKELAANISSPLSSQELVGYLYEAKTILQESVALHYFVQEGGKTMHELAAKDAFIFKMEEYLLRQSWAECIYAADKAAEAQTGLALRATATTLKNIAALYQLINVGAFAKWFSLSQELDRQLRLATSKLSESEERGATSRISASAIPLQEVSPAVEQASLNPPFDPAYFLREVDMKEETLRVMDVVLKTMNAIVETPEGLRAPIKTRTNKKGDTTGLHFVAVYRLFVEFQLVFEIESGHLERWAMFFNDRYHITISKSYRKYTIATANTEFSKILRDTSAVITQELPHLKGREKLLKLR
ncbi:MAG: hypothetical protein EOO61_03340 [Hymenobacter sp.]|nr:MAG: hypothetical protein EOO61_03340 [Hymenobacter sp.]